MWNIIHFYPVNSPLCITLTSAAFDHCSEKGNLVGLYNCYVAVLLFHDHSALVNAWLVVY